MGLIFLWVVFCQILKYLLIPDTIDQDDWLAILSSLPNLEVFCGGSLWASCTEQTLDEGMADVIHKIARSCPKLRQLDHWKFDDKRLGHLRIIISREGEQVTWDVRWPRAKYVRLVYIYIWTDIYHILYSTGFDPISRIF